MASVKTVSGTTTFPSDEVAEMLSEAVGELVWDQIREEFDEDEFDILGWTFDIPDIVVSWDVDIQETPELPKSAPFTADAALRMLLTEVVNEIEATFDNLPNPTFEDCAADLARRLNHLAGDDDD